MSCLVHGCKKRLASRTLAASRLQVVFDSLSGATCRSEAGTDCHVRYQHTGGRGLDAVGTDVCDSRLIHQDRRISRVGTFISVNAPNDGLSSSSSAARNHQGPWFKLAASAETADMGGDPGSASGRYQDDLCTAEKRQSDKPTKSGQGSVSRTRLVSQFNLTKSRCSESQVVPS